MNRLLELFKLTRIEHSLMLVIAVITAELISKGLPTLQPLILSLITPIFISAAAFAINDYFDVDVDRINMKKRPLVKGTIKKEHALYTSLLGFAIGVAASALINIYCLAIALLFAVLAFLYSYRLKEYTLLGNAYIAFSMAIPFIFGSYVVLNAPGLGILLISFMIFLSGLAREIHGTIRDYRGDAARHAKTLPVKIGRKPSAIVALILYAIAVIISAYLFFYVAPLRHNIVYIVVVSASDLMLLYAALGYLSKTDAHFYSIARNLSLIAMLLALLAILLAAVLPFHLLT